MLNKVLDNKYVMGATVLAGFLGVAMIIGGGFGHQFTVLGVGVGLDACVMATIALKVHCTSEEKIPRPGRLREEEIWQ